MKIKHSEIHEKLSLKMNSEKKQESAPGMVVRQLKQDIEAGTLIPGDKLPPQTKMANMYEVGISSIREAVNTLEVMGILEVIHGSGTYIKKEQPFNKSGFYHLELDLAKASTFELFELREMLECHVTRMAATRADDNALQKIVEKCDNLVKNASENQKFIEADRNFHKEICKAAGQHATSIIIDLIHHINHTHIKLAQTTLKEEYRVKAVETARQITSHIVSGNEIGAVRCMRSHLDIMRQSLS